MDRDSWEAVETSDMSTRHLWSQAQTLEIKNGVLYRRYEWADGTAEHYQILVPRSLRPEFLHYLHADVTSGHFGVRRTQEKCLKYAYWSSWWKDVESYVRRYDTCCRAQKDPRFQQGALQYAPGLTVMQKFHVDLTGPMRY